VRIGGRLLPKSDYRKQKSSLNQCIPRYAKILKYNFDFLGEDEEQYGKFYLIVS